MTRLENVIEEVKQARKGDRRPWIFDDNSHIKNNIFVGEILDILEELKEIEVDITDEEIKDIVNDNDESGNTYNWSANISNDINWNTKGDITVIMVHLYGDIRGGYSEYFAIKSECPLVETIACLKSSIQHKDIQGTHMVADINILSEEYGVYDYDKEETIGMFYNIELEDLLKAIKEGK